MSDRIRNWLLSATAVGVGAVVVLVVGAVALLGVNFSLSRGVWGETLGVPVFAVVLVGLGATVAVLVGRNATTTGGGPSAAGPPTRAAESPEVRSLALAFRPLLFFDSKEGFAPLDVDRLIHDERVQACHS